MKSIIFSILTISFYSWAEVELPSHGVYDNLNSPCSIKLTVHPEAKVVQAQMVHKLNGLFCPYLISLEMTCIKKDNRSRCVGETPNPAILYIESQSSVQFYSWDPKWNLGTMVKMGNETIKPYQFAATAFARWIWRNDSSRCKIPPYDAEILCSRIPYDLLVSMCPPLQKTAEELALNNCRHNSGHGDCKLTESRANIFNARPLPPGSPLEPDMLETGCEWIATFESK